MTAHPEREREVAGHQPANRKPLGEPLEHRTHDESQRLQEARFRIRDRPSRRKTRRGGAAPAARDCHRARGEPARRHDVPAACRPRSGLRTRQLAEPAHPHRASVVSRFVAAIRFSQARACRVAASSESRSRPLDHAHPPASRGQMRSSFVGATRRGFGIPTLRTHRKAQRDFFFAVGRSVQARENRSTRTPARPFDDGEHRFGPREQRGMRRAFRGGERWTTIPPRRSRAPARLIPGRIPSSRARHRNGVELGGAARGFFQKYHTVRERGIRAHDAA